MRLSNASLFDGSAREESEKVWEKVCKTSEKDRMKIQLRNNSDSSDDKIRLASKLVEVLVSSRPPSKTLRLPAWRPIHWI